MANVDKYNKWSGYSALVGIPASLVAIYTVIPTLFSIPFICTIVSIVIIYLYNRVKKVGWKKAMEDLFLINDRGVFADFENIHTSVKIDIKKNLKDAHFEQVRLVECKVQSANEYYIRFQPADKFFNIKYDHGDVKTESINAGGKDCIIKLKRPYDLNERASFKVTADMIDMFPSRSEFWKMHKYYEGVDVTHVEILFPKNKAPEIFDAVIIPNDNFGKHKKLQKSPKLILQDGRPTLIVDIFENETRHDEEIYISWEW